jgi:hypothetical protein
VSLAGGGALGGGDLAVDLRLVPAVGGAPAPSGLVHSLEALALARRGGAFALVGQALARVGVPLAFVGDPLAFVGDAVTPARHPLPGVRLPFALLELVFALLELVLLALRPHDAIVPGRRVPSS